MNEIPNNSVNHTEELAEVRKTRGLSRLVGFTDRQFQHINEWLDEQVAYRKISEYCLTEWQREVPHMTIARYAKRRMALTLAADLSDSKEAAAEISRYAATGDTSFSTNTLELLEQQAFDLAAVYQRDNDAADLEALTKLTTIINKARNTRVRERHAAVQEQKLQLRREELALKRELALLKINGGTSSTSPTSSSRDAIPNHDAAPADPNAGQAGNLSTFNAQPSTREAAPFKRFRTPCPLPLEIVIENQRYAEKLLAGLVDPDTGEELPDPIEPSNTNSVQTNHVPLTDAQGNGGAL